MKRLQKPMLGLQEPRVERRLGLLYTVVENIRGPSGFHGATGLKYLGLNDIRGLRVKD